MNYTEVTALFECSGDTLLGILTKPETPFETGVIVIVGGPQYRVGSHRQFVLLSRALGTTGYAVMRFDYRGMGDSEGNPHDFEAVSADIGAAIDTLQKCIPSVKQVVLWGLCDGASAALLYCHETRDPRVRGLCLLNPWVRSEVSLARTQIKHYYVQRLMQKEFWNKLLRGGVAFKVMPDLVRIIRVAFTDARVSGAAASASDRSTASERPFQHRMATAWDTFSGSIFLLLSDNDYTAKEFLEYASKDTAWKKTLTNPRLVRYDLQEADHTFSSAASRARVRDLTLSWVLTSFGKELSDLRL